MKTFKNAKWAVTLILSVLLLPVYSAAKHKTVKEGESIASYNKKKEAYLRQVENNPNQEQPYIELARVYYKLAGLSEETVQVRLLNQCLNHATHAIDISHNSAWGYYFRGLCIGKRGKAEGMFKSLDIIKPFRNAIETALKLDPKIGHGGPNRALGKMYFEMPFFIGGNNKKAIYHLNEAVRHDPKYWENHLFLAEVYYDEDNYAQAMQSLRTVLEVTENQKNDPKIRNKRREAEDLMHKIQSEM